jgi:NAD(P)-dependent dehydrogenase (short-subunit alcohol dehydrogenase family)
VLRHELDEVLSGPAGSAGRLAGTRALVTGASSGIGEAASRLFVHEGARVALVARRQDRLEAIAAELGGPDRALAFPCDVADDRAVARTVAAAWEAFGGVDTLVHSAGISKPTPLPDLTPELWREVIDVNLSGSFYIGREVGLRMREAGGGAIVNVASESAFLGEAAFVAYCASKGGIVALTRALAAELGPTVRVNVICPGTVDTPMLAADLGTLPDPEGARREVERRIPLGRLATADEIAHGILYLAEAGFATGMALNLDGGTTAFLAAFADE